MSEKTTKVTLTEKELELLTEAMHRIQILGIDAPFIAGILGKLYTAKQTIIKTVQSND